MTLQDLRTTIDEPNLLMPIGGTTYVVPPVSAAVYLALQALNQDAARVAQARAAAKAAGREATEDEVAPAIADENVSRWRNDALALYRECLSPGTYDAMLQAVTLAELQRAGATAYLWQLGYADDADTFWSSGGKAAAAESTSTSTAAATTTKRPASTSGTTSPRTSKPRSAARKSPGTASSRTAR
jgi:hypothetical protein